MTTAMLTDRHWSQRGLCRGNARMFDAETLLDLEEAKNACAICPVLAQCDDWRLTQRKSDLLGVVAGILHGK